MTFSAGGKVYKVTRRFGQGVKDDKFIFLNEETGEECRDFLDGVYPADNLGEGLFGVGVETFDRSVFITLDKSKITPATSDISALLNNLLLDNDMKDFDAALTTLEKEKRNLETRSTGKKEIPYLTEAIKDSLIKEEEALAFQKDLPSAKDKRAALTAALDEKKSELKTLEDALTEASEGEKLEVLKKERDLLDAAVNDAKDNLRECVESYGREPPTALEIAKKEKAVDYYAALLTDIEKKSPTKEDREELATLLPYLKIEKGEIEIIRDAKDAADRLKEKAFSLQKSLAASQEVLSKKLLSKVIPRGFFGALAAAGVSCALFVAFFIAKRLGLGGASFEAFFKEKILFIILGGAAVAGATLAAILRPRAQDVTKEKSTLKAIKTELDKIEREIKDNSTIYEDFIKKFCNEGGVERDRDSEATDAPSCNSYNNDIFSDILNKAQRAAKLKDDLDDFNTWLASRPRSVAECEDFIGDFLDEWGEARSLDLATIRLILDRAKSAATKRDFLEEALKKANERQKDFYKRNASELVRLEARLSKRKGLNPRPNEKRDASEGEKRIAAGKISDDTTDGNRGDGIKISTLRIVIEQFQEELSKTDRLIEDYTSKVVEAKFIREKREDFERLLKEKRSRVFIIEKTIEHLKGARAALEESYSGPLKKSFDKYLKAFNDKIPLNIAPNLEVTVATESGHLPAAFLSAGEGDIANLATRLALVDSLFQKETPPIILDDPFVNLDNDAVKRALELLHRLARGRQVIYLTCHNSRAI